MPDELTDLQKRRIEEIQAQRTYTFDVKITVTDDLTDVGVDKLRNNVMSALIAAELIPDNSPGYTEHLQVDDHHWEML